LLNCVDMNIINDDDTRLFNSLDEDNISNKLSLNQKANKIRHILNTIKWVTGIIICILLLIIILLYTKK